MESLQTVPPAAREGPSAIREGLEFCNTIFRIERDLRDASPAERHAARQARSRPVLARFARWLRTQKRQILPQSPLGKAVTYCLNQWKPLTWFLEDGRLGVDNTRRSYSSYSLVIDSGANPLWLALRIRAAPS
ncbi:transposase IS66 [Sulfobacillus acidophilus TPY]|nr:transposase IS66 [Sulfobacillus acidophilus TPY]